MMISASWTPIDSFFYDTVFFFVDCTVNGMIDCFMTQCLFAVFFLLVLFFMFFHSSLFFFFTIHTNYIPITLDCNLCFTSRATLR